MTVTISTYARLATKAYHEWREGSNFELETSGWRGHTSEKLAPLENNSTTGFSVSTFKNGDEYVVSFRGTDDPNIWPLDWTDWEANYDFCRGRISDQLVNAVAYVNQLLAENVPLEKIAFVGHSLGGGLAACMAVYFDRPAKVFDPAPYGDTLIDSGGPIVFPPDAVAKAESRVSVCRVGGEFISLLFDDDNFPSSSIVDYPLPNSDQLGLIDGPKNLHSAMLQVLAIEHQTNPPANSIYVLAERFPTLLNDLMSDGLCGPVNTEKPGNGIDTLSG